jgi:hypothetical protein
VYALDVTYFVVRQASYHVVSVAFCDHGDEAIIVAKGWGHDVYLHV